MTIIPVAVPLARNLECRLSLSDTVLLGAGVSRDRVSRHTRFWGKRGVVLAALLLASVGAWAQNGVFAAPQAVGAPVTQNVTVNASAPGVVATVDVLTMGAPSLDFVVGGGASTCTTATLTTAPPSSCVESVTFMPTAPGVRMGAVVLLDLNNNVLGTAYLSGTGVGGLAVLAPGNLLPVAGSGAFTGPVVDNILATNAKLYLPGGVAVDGIGNLYIADTLHSRIRMVCSAGNSATCGGAGFIVTLAGTGAVGDFGDNGLAVNANLNLPVGVALDGAGNLYIADTDNNVIRKVTPTTGLITTIAGNGTAGYQGDGLLATDVTTELDAPQGIALDVSGNLYIADTNNNVIRKVTIATGVISTVVGSLPGTAGFGGDTLAATNALVKLNAPSTVAFDSSGNLYIADTLNNRIRVVNATTNVITTFAGNGTAGYVGDGLRSTNATVELNAPSGVAVDPAGNVYIADTQNYAIRKVNAVTGIISTIVVNGTGNYYGPTAAAPSSNAFQPIKLQGPLQIALDSSANLYFADSFTNTVRELQSNFVALDFTGGALQTKYFEGTVSPAIPQTVENDGNGPLYFPAPPPDFVTLPVDSTGFVNAELVTPPTTCQINTNPFFNAVDGTCVIGAAFAPSSSLIFGIGIASATLTPTINIGATGNTVNSPVVIELVGTATPLNATTLTLTSSLNPSHYLNNVTFRATIATGTGTPTGTVTFYDNGVQIGAHIAVDVGVANLTISTLTVGLHPITATYSGDPTHFGSSTVSPLRQIVNEATTTVLTAIPVSPSVLGTSVTFTATVTPGPGGVALPLSDTVTFANTTTGTTLCLVVPIIVAGPAYQATCVAPALPQGLNTITAVYSGDVASYITSSTGTLLQDVQATTSTVVVSSQPTSTFGLPVTLTATVTSGGIAITTGTVFFYDGATLIGTGSLGALGVPAGNATFTTSTLAVGSHTITADYQANANYSASNSPPITQVVNPTTTRTVVTAVPNPGVAGGPVAITATVTVTLGVATPTGTVTFTDSLNGGPATPMAGSPATLISPAGTATINPILGPGSHLIVATYSGDMNDGTSSGQLLLAVFQAATTTTLTSSANPALVLAPITFTARVVSVGGGVPTGNVTFTATLNAGPTVVLPCAGALTAGTATCTTAALAVGSYTITASYLGDTNDLPSSNTITQVVGTIPTVTDLAIVTTTGVNPQVILVATVLNDPTIIGDPPPSGTVVFSTVNGAIVTQIGSATLDANGVATMIPSVPTGTYVMQASYLGDSIHSPSMSNQATFSTTAFGYNLTVNPPTVSVAASGNTTVTVALTSYNGFTDTIGLGCASLPAGVNCHFSAVAPVLLATNTTSNPLTVALTIDTNNPLGGGASSMNRQQGNRNVFLAGLFLPLSVLFGCIFWRFRRRHARWMTTGLVLLMGFGALVFSGCSGSFTQSSATPGTYVIQITGTGSQSNISHYQNVTLTITAK